LVFGPAITTLLDNRIMIRAVLGTPLPMPVGIGN